MNQNEHHKELDAMVRDFTGIPPRSKGEVRRRIKAYADHFVEINELVSLQEAIECDHAQENEWQKMADEQWKKRKKDLLLEISEACRTVWTDEAGGDTTLWLSREIRKRADNL
jgi:hypothetical protein